jgi:hypothetical protein
MSKEINFMILEDVYETRNSGLNTIQQAIDIDETIIPTTNMEPYIRKGYYNGIWHEDENMIYVPNQYKCYYLGISDLNNVPEWFKQFEPLVTNK